jgi:hypothetical protein
MVHQKPPDVKLAEDNKMITVDNRTGEVVEIWCIMRTTKSPQPAVAQIEQVFECYSLITSAPNSPANLTGHPQRCTIELATPPNTPIIRRDTK